MKHWQVKSHHPSRRCPRCHDAPMGIDWDAGLERARKWEVGDPSYVDENPWMRRVCDTCGYVVYESYLKYVRAQDRSWGRADGGK